MSTVTALALSDWQDLRDARHEAARAFPDVAAWLEDAKYRNLATRTISDFRYTAARLLRDHMEKELADYTTYDLKTWLAKIPSGARPTVQSHVKSLFSFAYDDDRIPADPAAKLKPVHSVKQSVPGVFTDVEVNLLCQNPLVALMLHTGIRRSECRNLQRRHISLETATLNVYRGKGRKDRAIPLNAVALKAVADMDLIERLNPADHLWSCRPGGGEVVSRSRPVAETTFRNWWVTTLDELGVAYRNPHTTRHTFATRYLRAGGRLETLRLVLGHASIRTTVDQYAHLDLADARADMERLVRETNRLRDLVSELRAEVNDPSIITALEGVLGIEERA